MASQRPIQPVHDSGVRVNKFAGRPVSTQSSRSVVHPSLPPAARLKPQVPVELDRPGEPNSPASPVDLHTPRPSRLVVNGPANYFLSCGARPSGAEWWSACPVRVGSFWNYQIWGSLWDIHDSRRPARLISRVRLFFCFFF